MTLRFDGYRSGEFWNGIGCFGNVLYFKDLLNEGKGKSREELLTGFINDRLGELTKQYQIKLQEAVDGLNFTSEYYSVAEQVYREIAYQQKLKLKVLQQEFDPEELKKKYKEEQEDRRYLAYDDGSYN